MSDKTSERNAEWLANVNVELLAPAQSIRELSLSLLGGVKDTGPDALLPDVECIVDSANDLSTMIEDLSGKGVAEELFAGRSEHETARKLRHDLRTPIGGVKGYGEMILEDLEDMGDDRLRPSFAKLLDEANALLKRLEKVVNFPDEEAGPQTGGPVTGGGKAKPRASAASRKTKHSGRILVADDIATNRDLLQQQLTREGYTVTLTEDGRQALAAADREDFDVILLDMMMPGLDGIGTLARLKADGRLQEIPVIMISALDEEDKVIQCIEAGAEDYLTKPFNPVLLRARINSCIERKRSHDREMLYRDSLEQEKKKSEELLLNILPSQIVERINDGEDLIADRYENVTVLFSDLVGFTEISARMGPSELVRSLNSVFSRFDVLAEELGVEKVKTIGDAYMVVAGLPEEKPDHAEAIADMALGMIAVIDEINPALVHPYAIRIGVHSGPVVAGIIGTHKYIYDVWGSTVNIASRYESYSLPDKIHVSAQVARALKKKFKFESRGTLDMRGVGEVETFFLEGRLEDG